MDLFKSEKFSVIRKLPIAKSKHDTSYLEIIYWKRVHNYLGTSEGSILNVQISTASVSLIVFVWKKASSQR